MDGNSSNPSRRIALVAGGISAEREVSLASGRNASAALAKAGYLPVTVDPLEVRLDALDWPTFDACFIALHGGAGEDGRTQAQLEKLGVVYTGSGPAASRLAMSKSAAKERFLRRGVPTLPYVVFPAGERIDEVAVLVQRIGYPLIIKPNGQGSSLGMNLVSRVEELPHAVADAARFDTHLVAELFLPGREFTVSLLGHDPLPLVEIRSPARIFTYQCKYQPSATEYLLDAALPADIEARIYNAAMAAVQAIGTTGLVRVDLMLDAHGRPWVLEVNTVPGLTERSLAPRAAKAAGMEMPTLVDWMIRDAHLRSLSTRNTVINRRQTIHAALRTPRAARRSRTLLTVEDAA